MSKAGLEPNIIAQLCNLLNVNIADLLVESLSGGLSNRSFRVSHDTNSWAVRFQLETEETRFQTLDIGSEERLLIAVAQAGLTPNVVLHDPDIGVLITKYMENAVTWTAEKAQLPENIERVATTLRLLHGVEVSSKLNPFHPISFSERYLEEAVRSKSYKNCSGVLSTEEQGWGRELQRLASMYETNFLPSVLCHNDLVAANILDDGKLWLIDFEYALYAHPILDLASLAGMNNYDAAQRNLLVEMYFDTESIPFSQVQLDEVIRLQLLLSYFWALSRRGNLAEPNDMSDFADSIATMLR